VCLLVRVGFPFIVNYFRQPELEQLIASKAQQTILSIHEEVWFCFKDFICRCLCALQGHRVAVGLQHHAVISLQQQRQQQQEQQEQEQEQQPRQLQFQQTCIDKYTIIYGCLAC